MLARIRASRVNERGRRLAEEGDPHGAVAAYLAAIEADDRYAPVWFNLALECKLAGDWLASFAAGQTAAALRPTNYESWWNLGIAATALGEWDIARMAWENCGVEVPSGDGPFAGQGGPCPVRLDPGSVGEVVWGERLDPARVRLLSVPLPSSGHRWLDVVLHDGVPAGQREWNGQSFPVFDELVRLEPSDVVTWETHVAAPTPEDSHSLEELFTRRGGAAEDWTRSVRHMCQTCSSQTVSATSRSGEWTPRRHFGLALRGDHHRSLLEAWQNAGSGRSFELPSPSM